MFLYQQSEATAAQRRVPLHLVDATDGITPELNESGGQPQVSKNGSSFSNTTATLVAVGNGAYYVELSAAELDTLGFAIVRYKSAATAEAQVAVRVVDWLDNLDATISQLHFRTDEAVHIDVAGGSSGTTYPLGTPEDPVDNLANAITIATTRGITTLVVSGALTLTQSVAGYRIIGKLSGFVDSLALNGQNTALCEFERLGLSGAASGGFKAEACVFGNVTNLATECRDSIFTDTVELANFDSAFLDCKSQVAGTGTPVFDMDSIGQDLNMRGWIGGIELRNCVAGSNVSLDVLSGNVKLVATDTGGTIVVRGGCNLSDLSAGSTVVDNRIPTLSSDAVWDETVAGHTTDRTMGFMLDLIFSILDNPLRLADGSVANWVLRNDGDTITIRSYDVTDKNGNAVTQPTGSPSQRSKGT